MHHPNMTSNKPFCTYMQKRRKSFGINHFRREIQSMHKAFAFKWIYDTLSLEWQQLVRCFFLLYWRCPAQASVFWNVRNTVQKTEAVAFLSKSTVQMLLFLILTSSQHRFLFSLKKKRCKYFQTEISWAIETFYVHKLNTGKRLDPEELTIVLS